MRVPLLTVLVTILVFGFVLAGTVDIYTVTGRSMEPLVFSGQIVVIDRVSYRFRDPRFGELLVANDPFSDGLILKQFAGVDENNLVHLEGKNTSLSVDSRQYGGLPRSDVRGRVVLFGGNGIR